MLAAVHPTCAFPGPLVMGILNVTPDSFSDGGRFADAASALEFGRKLVADGADLIDIGGESTRPGSLPVTADEQWKRIGRVVAELSRSAAKVSVDTQSSEVARRALDSGAVLINDVSAGSDPQLFEVIAAARATVIVMHMRGVPRSMQQQPHYDDCASEVLTELQRARSRAIDAGVLPDHVWIDPGIGFGKTLAHNIELLQSLDRFTSDGTRVVVGTSRKAFIDACSPSDVAHRLAGSLASLVPAWNAGVHAVRVHDVFETRQFFNVLARMAAP